MTQKMFNSLRLTNNNFANTRKTYFCPKILHGRAKLRADVKTSTLLKYKTTRH